MKVAQSLFLLASFSLSCKAAATVSDIASDVVNTIAQAKSLEQTFNGINNYNWMFSGPNLHTGVNSVNSGMERVTKDIMALPSLPLPEDEATTLLNAGSPLFTLAGQFVQSLLSRKQELANLPIVGPFSTAMVFQELTSLQSAVNALSDAVVKTVPTSLAKNATDLTAAIGNALTSALDAYSTKV